MYDVPGTPVGTVDPERLQDRDPYPDPYPPEDPSATYREWQQDPRRSARERLELHPSTLEALARVQEEIGYPVADRVQQAIGGQPESRGTHLSYNEAYMRRVPYRDPVLQAYATAFDIYLDERDRNKDMVWHIVRALRRRGLMAWSTAEYMDWNEIHVIDPIAPNLSVEQRRQLWQFEHDKSGLMSVKRPEVEVWATEKRAIRRRRYEALMEAGVPIGDVLAAFDKTFFADEPPTRATWED